MQSPRSPLDSTGQRSAEILLLAPAKVCREGTQVPAQEPQAHSCILRPAPCWLAEGLEEPTDSGCVTPTFCLHLTLPQHIRNLHRPPPAPQLTLARLDEEPRTLFQCSSKISAQYSYLRNDTAAPQKCKISISWASHSNCLWGRTTSGGYVFQEAFVFFFQRAGKLPSCLQEGEAWNQNGILWHQPYLQYQMKCCRCCLESSLSCTARFHCAKPKSLQNRSCFPQGSLCVKKRRRA